MFGARMDDDVRFGADFADAIDRGTDDEWGGGQEANGPRGRSWSFAKVNTDCATGHEYPRSLDALRD